MTNTTINRTTASIAHLTTNCKPATLASITAAPTTKIVHRKALEKTWLLAEKITAPAINDDCDADIFYTLKSAVGIDYMDAIQRAHAAAPQDGCKRAYMPALLDASGLQVDNAIEATAQIIGCKVAKKSEEREGTKKQCEVAAAARCRDYDHDYLHEMIYTATLSISEVLQGDITQYTRRCNVLMHLANMLKKIPMACTQERVEAMDLARNELGKINDYFGANAIVNDYVAVQRAARYAALVRDSIAIRDLLGNNPTADSISRLTFTAVNVAYKAVNNLLVADRAINVSQRPAPLSLGELLYSGEENAENYAAEAACKPLEWQGADNRPTTAINAVNRALYDCYVGLTPTQQRVWVLLAKGYSVTQVANATNRYYTTVQGHIKAIEAAASATLAGAISRDTARAAGVAAVVADINAADIARVQAKQAKTQAVKAAEKTTQAVNATAIKSAVASAVNGLTPVRRAVYDCVVNGMGLRDIARCTGRTPSTVHKAAAAVASVLVGAIASANPTADVATLHKCNLQALVAILAKI